MTGGMMDRGWIKAGGWAAMALAVLDVLRTAMQLAAFTAHSTSESATGAAGLLVLVLAMIATAAVLPALEQTMTPPSLVLRLGGLAGLLGALALPIAHVAQAPLIFIFAPTFTGAWLLCIAAVMWRRRRFPTWLRVVGAVLGAMLFMQPAIPPLGALGAVLGVVWWPGLGLALLQRPPARLA